MLNQFLFSHLLSLLFFQLLIFNYSIYFIKTGDEYFCALVLHILFKGCWSYESNIKEWFHCLVIGLIQDCVRSISFIDKIFPPYLPCYFFIQSSLYFPHVRVSVHVFTLQGLVSFNLLIFLVHSLVLLICIFLMLKLRSWLL